MVLLGVLVGDLLWGVRGLGKFWGLNDGSEVGGWQEDRLDGCKWSNKFVILCALYGFGFVGDTC